jgi:choline dehydrogenase-like flavoprotein
VTHLVLQGKDRTHVHAQGFALCAGGLEVPRLLLAANSQQARGIGNDHDVVGRYYMGHLCGIVAQAEFDSRRQIDPSYTKNSEGIYVRRRFSIDAECQQREALPNSAALLHHPMIGNPAHGNGVLSLMFLAIFYFRTIRAQIPPCFLGLERGRYPRNRLVMLHVANVLKDLPNVLLHFPVFAANRYFAKRRIPSFVPPNNTGRYPLYYLVEQEPNPNSRVTLSSRTDELGIPRLKSEFQTSDGDLDRVMRVHDFLGDYFTRTGTGRIEYLSDDPRQDVLDQIDMGDAHFIGTSRMGEDRASSVVDSQCRVHGYDNLYIVSSSVFPTSGQANPTLTIVALALRVAGFIGKRLQA